jgi:NAD(P)-dependent dehydrogenase (short-subunit alcohol dehydrogenase family)
MGHLTSTPASHLVAILLALVAMHPRSARAQELEPVAGQAPEPGQRVVFVTGSTGGLGRVVALRLARQGDHVIVHGRNLDRGSELVDEIAAETSGSARFYAADLGSLDEVRGLAAAVRRDYTRLDVLVNNAGILLGGPRRLSEDGHELHFQVNYLADYLLTFELLPLLEASAPARIVHVASIAQQPIDFDDPMLEEGYSDGRAYAQSKLAQITFSMDLADELEGTGVTTNAVHPATLMDTDMVLERSMRVMSSVEDGADSVMNLIDGEGTGSGRYFDQLEPAEADPQAYDPDAQRSLRALSVRLTGVGGGAM